VVAVRQTDRRHPVFLVHRIGAVVVGLVLWVFAILGLVGHVGFFSTDGAHALGMTSNGLLSTISLVVGAVLIASALRGGPTAATTLTVVGGLFVLSGLLNMIVLGKSANYLAFTIANVIFSLVLGLVMLSVGLYGRASGQLPPDNPYRQARGGANPLARIWHDEDLAQGASGDVAADERRLAEIDEMAHAEHAVAEGEATPEQEQRVMADAVRRAEEHKRSSWERAEGDSDDSGASRES
jgi:Domain of unknown function (DUF4383)